MSENIRFDPYSPDEMAERVEKVGVAKARLAFLDLSALGFLAGAFIAFGAQFFTFVTHDSPFGFGLTMFIGGAAFSLGLVLVVIAGAELFTGNNLMAMAYASRCITLRELLRNWVIVYFANFLGAIGMVLWIYATQQWALNDYGVGARALLIANAKVNLTLLQALARGTMANTLVALAVWLTFAGRSVTDKILAIVFPITAFVASGFEHSIANMYFVPFGILLKSSPQVVEVATRVAGGTLDLANLTWPAFLIRNLIPVTIGNILGGSVFVGVVYWFVYLRGENC